MPTHKPHITINKWHILGVAAIAYTLLSIVNHVMFRTYGLDLGLYTHAMYDYSHLRCDDCSFFQETPRNFLSDHFDLYLILFTPLLWIFGSYTLLVVQIIAILFGALGVYNFVKCINVRMWKCESKTNTLTHSNINTFPNAIPLLAMVSFLLFFGVWDALGFDYHSNVVAAMWVPWLLYWLKRERYRLYALAVVMVCIAKENMPLWLLFILIALMWDYRHNRRALLWLTGGIVFSMAYLVLVTMVVMPSLNPEKVHFLGKFKYMGDSFGTIAVWILTHPLETIRNLFVNFLDLPQGNGLKTEFYLCLLISGGLFCLLKPNWLIMLLPLVAQKMLADDIALWGVGNHYSVEFAPVVVCGVFAAASRFKSSQARPTVAVAIAMPLLCLGVTIYTCTNAKAWVQQENVRLFYGKHYQQRDFDRHYTNQLLKRIPDNASVCASQCFSPHLALRDSIYLYPIGLQHNPQYILITQNDITPDTAGWHLIETDGKTYLLATN